MTHLMIWVQLNICVPKSFNIKCIRNDTRVYYIVYVRNINKLYSSNEIQSQIIEWNLYYIEKWKYIFW